jgi:hypothetical protein
MSGKILVYNRNLSSNIAFQSYRFYCEKKKDSKKDIFNKQSSSSQEQYFRHESARQLKLIKEKLVKELDKKIKSHESEEKEKKNK